MTRVVLEGSLEPRIAGYTVTGETLKEVEESIRRSSPNPGGLPFYTSWEYAWNKIGDESFDLEIILRVGITITGPTWTGQGSPELVREWERYHELTMSHELNHARIYTCAIRRMCEVKDVGRFKSIEKLANDLSLEYDRITDNGRAEGAQLEFRGTVKNFDAQIDASCKKIMSQS